METLRRVEQMRLVEPERLVEPVGLVEPILTGGASVTGEPVRLVEPR